MLDFFDVRHRSLDDFRSKDLFSLRKSVFKDRLNWMVSCHDGMESDKYDSHQTVYLLGKASGHLICGVRFIETKYPNMITHVFNKYFNKIEIPSGNFIEASRLFIDKNRSEVLRCKGFPVSATLFLSMINYARYYRYDGIYAIVSHSMYIIFKRSGWPVSIVERGVSEKNENIYLIFMPVDEVSQKVLTALVKNSIGGCCHSLTQWPLSFVVREKGSNDL
ncbi:acyl-homoserine-lactone synthase [Pantoea coffeiphila]|uniref:Acyl-homoserine-lactone synthase n=1 Tax=Pantoea coffeiphila TaxID=1465635 RepID=A0A2S9IHL9_9GAMM|nr:acyl-homoserine-lactone synthase [Pantoea coffeiphila]PRD17283.1 acyl-homoserine-lactone synthase [Pantoea coffeiphila]